MPPEGMAQTGKFCAQLVEIINFPIVDNDVAAIGGEHGLTAGGREVQDGEAAEA